MSLLKQIPKEFYNLFRTTNREYYFEILIDLYQANMEEYHTFGMDKNTCRDRINETMVRLQIVWQEDEEENEQENQELGEQMEMRTPAARSLANLIKWGWLREDYDEQLNEEILTFPEYSQMFVELFWELGLDSDSQERESIMAVYSLLYTYHLDKDHNNDILKNAWKTSRRLTLLLNNMQDGMRAYFDKLSAQRNVLGIQEVLVQELSNNDSKKYAMLTTTDSFYRYKEQVKELISDILEDNESKSQETRERWMLAEPASKEAKILERKMKVQEETGEYIMHIEREFDSIEKKYNHLIEQKAVFAQRALARVRFMLQEGIEENENVAAFIQLVSKRLDGETMIEELRERMAFSRPFYQMGERSLYQKRSGGGQTFAPKPVEKAKEESEDMTDFIPKPLYSGQELQEFRQKNTVGGRFVVTDESIENVEDLEKLMLLWQQVTRETKEDEDDSITLGKEIRKQLSDKQSVAYTQIMIEEDSDV